MKLSEAEEKLTNCEGQQQGIVKLPWLSHRIQPRWLTATDNILFEDSVVEVIGDGQRDGWV